MVSSNNKLENIYTDGSTIPLYTYDKITEVEQYGHDGNDISTKNSNEYYFNHDHDETSIYSASHHNSNNEDITASITALSLPTKI